MLVRSCGSRSLSWFMKVSESLFFRIRSTLVKEKKDDVFVKGNVKCVSNKLSASR